MLPEREELFSDNYIIGEPPSFFCRKLIVPPIKKKSGAMNGAPQFISVMEVNIAKVSLFFSIPKCMFLLKLYYKVKTAEY